MRNNKTAGNKCELYFLKKLQLLYKDKLYTTRNVSKLSDDKKIDIENETLTLPFKYQIKQSVKRIKYDDILNSMDDNNDNIILHQLTEKRGERFFKKDDYVIMKYEVYEKIMKRFF